LLDQIRRLLSLFAARARRQMAGLVVLMIVAAVLEVAGVAAIPAFVGAVMDPGRLQDSSLAPAIERIGIETQTDIVIFGGLLLFAVFLVKNGFLIFNLHLQTKFVARRRIALSRRMAHAYLNAPYAFHLARNSAEIVRNINREVAVLANQTLTPLLELCTRLFILLCVLGFLFVVEPVVTLVFVTALAGLGVLGALFVSGRLRAFGETEQDQGRVLLQQLQEASGSFKEMKVAGREPYFARRIANAVERMADTQRYRQLVSKAMSPVLETVAVAGILLLAAWLVLGGRTTEELIVTLSLFVVGLVRLRETLAAIVTHLANLRFSLVSVEPIHAHLQMLEPEQRDVGAQAPRPVRIDREIALRDVWVRYGPDLEHALKGIDVTIRRGEAVAFVGSSGAGKSTLVDTVLALLEPEHGEVLVDGVDIRTIGLRNWQASVGYVPQSIHLLDDTLRRNVAFGVPDEEIDHAAVERAVAMAQLEPFVARQERGLDTRVGERGGRLSGGERQRVGIARALYRDPAVLVFDEATSALDNTTERAVIAAVDALKGTRTVIMIAHRLSTVRNCDRLHFLKDGRIHASGTYDELEHENADFRLMAAG
jgi:ATP-binding cassette subfamily C protein